MADAAFLDALLYPHAHAQRRLLAAMDLVGGHIAASVPRPAFMARPARPERSRSFATAAHVQCPAETGLPECWDDMGWWIPAGC